MWFQIRILEIFRGQNLFVIENYCFITYKFSNNLQSHRNTTFVTILRMKFLLFLHFGIRHPTDSAPNILPLLLWSSSFWRITIVRLCNRSWVILILRRSLKVLILFSILSIPNSFLISLWNPSLNAQ